MVKSPGQCNCKSLAFLQDSACGAYATLPLTPYTNRMHPSRMPPRSNVAPSLRILAVVAATTLLIAGCSVPRLAYQQADWLVLREFDKYMDLRDEQREQIGIALKALLSRHRVEQLPQLAKTLEDAGSRARNGFAEADARWAFAQGLGLFNNFIELVLPTVASALTDLSPEQRRYLARRMRERNEENAEKFAVQAPHDEQVSRATKRSIERIEQWVGPLSEEQVALIDDANNAMSDYMANWIIYTHDRQLALLALLEQGASTQDVANFLRGWWVRRDAMPLKVAGQRDERITSRINLIVRIDQSLDSQQREHLLNRLEDLAQDARSLAAGA